MIHDPNHPLNHIEPDYLTADHWSRYLTKGRGIICGFEWVMLDDCTIQMCGGSGISSDGTLVCSPRPNYHFTHVEDFSTGAYPPFQNDDSQAIPLWELLEGRPEGNTTARPLTPQNDEEEREAFLSDKFLLVYLDSAATEDNDDDTPERPADNAIDDGYDRPGAIQEYGNQRRESRSQSLISTSAGSETSGGRFRPAEVQNNSPAGIRYRLRFLLISQADLIRNLGLEDRVLQHVERRQADDDYVYSEAYSAYDDMVYELDIYQAAEPRFDLPEIFLRRLGYGCLDPFDCEPGDLDISEYPQWENLDVLYEAYVCVVNAATKELDREIGRLQSWLSEHFYCHPQEEWQEWLAMLCEKWEAYKSLNHVQDSSRHRKELVQYFYDWCRDLIAAYHELRQAVHCWKADCRWDSQAHPRHLLLGPAMRKTPAFHPPALRHEFREVPASSEAAKMRERIRMMHLRLLLAIKNFYLPNAIPDSSINPYCQMEEAGETEELPTMNELRLTPSKYYDKPLGKQSLPYYYPLSEGRFSMERFWSAERSRHLRMANHRSYHARPYSGSYTHEPWATNPLRFNVDTDDLYRIEGHIGMVASRVESRLGHIRSAWNLTFEVETYALNEINPNPVVVVGQGGRGGTHYPLLERIRGAEHLAGVRPGGTFILLTETRTNPETNEEEDIVIADFSLVDRCCAPDVQDDPDEPIETANISGTVRSCSDNDDGVEQSLPGVNVVVEGSTNGTITDIDGNFRLGVPTGSTITIRLSFVGFEPFEQSLTVTGDLTLGDIILRPSGVTLNMAFLELGNRTILKVYVNQPDGTEISTTDTTNNGRYLLQGLDRLTDVLFYDFIVGDGDDVQTGQLNIDLQQVCAIYRFDYNLRSNQIVTGVGRTFDITATLDDRYYELANVAIGSNRALEIRESYGRMLAASTDETIRTVNEAGLSDSAREAVSANLEKLVADPDLNTAGAHREYRKAMNVLSNERANLSGDRLVALDMSMENMTKVYLDRMVGLQPDNLTTGASNALKHGAEKAPALDFAKITTDWATNQPGIALAGLTDRLKAFRS
ncbi:MAG: carboxypeptidase-like regulatory domain-containing protein [Bacteroidota bacterium]